MKKRVTRFWNQHNEVITILAAAFTQQKIIMLLLFTHKAEN